MACGSLCASENGTAAHEPHTVFDSVGGPWSWPMAKEWALSLLPYGLRRLTTYTMASLRKVYWIVYLMAADQSVWQAMAASRISLSDDIPASDLLFWVRLLPLNDYPAPAQPKHREMSLLSAVEMARPQNTRGCMTRMLSLDMQQ